MPDLLDNVLSEIRARLNESRDAVAEYRRLEAALAALDGSPEPGSSGRGSERTGARRRAPAAAAPRRAPRGANRAVVLRVVAERPGITTSELAAASGVKTRTLYTLLSTLRRQGDLERQELPGGQTGYRLASQTSSAAA